MDGEGTFTAADNGHSVWPTVTVTNTHKGIIYWIRRVTRPLRSSLTRPKKRNPRHKQAYKLTFDSTNARAIAKELIPYLKIKKKVAKLIATFPRRKVQGNPSSGIFLPDIKGAKRQRKIIKRIRAYNKRGL